jgi:hypothetical protein
MRGDGFRESGFSKERRLEPQITIGLLTDHDGFPLMVSAFEGNKAGPRANRSRPGRPEFTRRRSRSAQGHGLRRSMTPQSSDTTPEDRADLPRMYHRTGAAGLVNQT